MRGVLGTSIVRVCGVVAGGTGLTEKAAKKAGMKFIPLVVMIMFLLIYSLGLLGRDSVNPPSSLSQR